MENRRRSGQFGTLRRLTAQRCHVSPNIRRFVLALRLPGEKAPNVLGLDRGDIDSALAETSRQQPPDDAHYVFGARPRTFSIYLRRRRSSSSVGVAPSVLVRNCESAAIRRCLRCRSAPLGRNVTPERRSRYAAPHHCQSAISMTPRSLVERLIRAADSCV